MRPESVREKDDPLAIVLKAAKLGELNRPLTWPTMALVINGRSLARPVTGVERYARMMIAIAAKEWPDCKIAVPSSMKTSTKAFGCEVIRIPGNGGHAWEQVLLPKALSKNDVLLSPANTGPLRVRRQAVVVHDLAVIHHPEWFDRRFAMWYRFLLPRLVHRVDRVISVSQTSLTDIQRTLGVPLEKSSVVHPYSMIEPGVVTNAGIGSPYYLIVGSLDPRKGIDSAMAWYASLDRPAFKLVQVGRTSTSFASNVVPPVPGVIRLDEVNDEHLSALYHGALALIQLSQFEGFGLPILEAMQHGCPVVASDLQVFRELFGDAPIFVDPTDHARMNEATQELSQPAQREERVGAGRIRATHFSEARMTEELHVVLDPLLGC
ncbi:MAG: glycosyltransferase family 4 protein [Flavobacteriales bacterium]|nr:glycosyltransferase family 4 protein [Flavobacteriales bacterium]